MKVTILIHVGVSSLYSNCKMFLLQLASFHEQSHFKLQSRTGWMDQCSSITRGLETVGCQIFTQPKVIVKFLEYILVHVRCPAQWDGYRVKL